MKKWDSEKVFESGGRKVVEKNTRSRRDEHWSLSCSFALFVVLVADNHFVFVRRKKICHSKSVNAFGLSVRQSVCLVLFVFSEFFHLRFVFARGGAPCSIWKKNKRQCRNK